MRASTLKQRGLYIEGFHLAWLALLGLTVVLEGLETDAWPAYQRTCMRHAGHGTLCHTRVGDTWYPGS